PIEEQMLEGYVIGQGIDAEAQSLRDQRRETGRNGSNQLGLSRDACDTEEIRHGQHDVTASDDSGQSLIRLSRQVSAGGEHHMRQFTVKVEREGSAGLDAAPDYRAVVLARHRHNGGMKGA